MQRAYTAIDGQNKRHTDLHIFWIPEAEKAENMHSVLRFSRSQSLDDVTQTRELTEQISFAHLDSKDERKLIRNFVSRGGTTLKLS